MNEIDGLPPPESVRGQFDLTGSVALVTGGASGLGRAIAWGFACHGADLVIADRDEAGAQHLAERAHEPSVLTRTGKYLPPWPALFARSSAARAFWAPRSSNAVSLAKSSA